MQRSPAGAKFVVVPECGHAYPALRWDGPNVVGRAFPFEVLAISELIGRELESGRLRLTPLGPGKRVTFHDPCKFGRKGGVIDEPRKALAALERRSARDGVEGHHELLLWRRRRCVFHRTRGTRCATRPSTSSARKFDATGADSVVTSCGSCRMNFAAGAQQNNWNMPIESLVELVADSLAATRPSN